MDAEVTAAVAPTHLLHSAAITRRQLLRFGAVGIGLNGVSFLAYLGLARSGFNPKLAMTAVYVAGVVLGFVLNRHWSFSSPNAARHGGLRYALVCSGGYGLNLAVLVVCVDWLAWPHPWVQASMVFVIAGLTFILNKFWVFSTPDH